MQLRGEEDRGSVPFRHRGASKRLLLEFQAAVRRASWKDTAGHSKWKAGWSDLEHSALYTKAVSLWDAGDVLSLDPGGGYFAVVWWLSCAWLLRPPWTVPTRLPCPWNSPGKSTGVGCLSCPAPSGYLGAYKCKNSSSCMLKIYSFMDLSLITSKPFIFNGILFFFWVIYLAAPALNWGTWGSSIFTAAFKSFSGSMWIVRCDMWDLIPWPGIETCVSSIASMESLPLDHQRSPTSKSFFFNPATLLTPN